MHFAERVCLHEQCAVCAVLRSKGRQTLAHDAIRIGQQLVVEAVQQIIVIRAVKAQSQRPRTRGYCNSPLRA